MALVYTTSVAPADGAPSTLYPGPPGLRNMLSTSPAAGAGSELDACLCGEDHLDQAGHEA